MPSIVTQRLILRQLAADDADQLFALLANWAVIEFLSAPPWPYQSAHMTDFIARVQSDTAPDREIFRTIVRDGRPIGGISLRQRLPSHLQSGAGPNVGYWLGEPHWGKGYMTEAVNGLVQHVFATSDAHAIYSGAFTANAASLRVQYKLGFVNDGETTLHSNPQNTELAHMNTKLTRGAFEASNRRNSPR